MTQWGYRQRYLKANPVGPYYCCFCEDEVTDLHEPNFKHWVSSVIHHLDHNKKNNDMRNLAPAHYRCHWEHHWSEKGRKK